MPNASAKISVDSELKRIVEDLTRIAQSSKIVGMELDKAGDKIGETLSNQAKKTQENMNALGTLTSRVAKRIVDDFKALASLNALTSAMSLSNQFKGTMTQGIALSDQIRKLSSVFGIAKQDFGTFQSAMSKGLGEIGLSSEAATNALQGLAETPVRGEEALIAYSKTAGQLASISGKPGTEGDIAKSMANIIISQGGNPSDIGNMNDVVKQIVRIRNATGKGAAEIAGTLNDLFEDVNQTFMPMLKAGGTVTLGAAAMQGGPQATSFLKGYLGKESQSRLALEGMGFGNIMKPSGELNKSVIDAIMTQAKKMGIGGEPESWLKIFMGDEGAKGFVRLAQAMDKSVEKINGASKAMANVNYEFDKAKSLGEAFSANINKVTGSFGGVVGEVTNPLRDFLNESSKSTAGATLVTIGGGLLAAILSGFALKTFGGFLGGTAKEWLAVRWQRRWVPNLYML